MEHSTRRTFTPVTFTLTCVFQTPPPQLARTSALLPRHSLQPELLLPPEVFPGGLRTHSTVNHKPEEAADAVVMTTRSKKKKNKKKLAKRWRQHPDALAFPWAAGCCPTAGPRRFFPKPSWVQMSKARLAVSPETWGGKGRDPSKAAPWCWVGSWRDGAIPASAISIPICAALVKDEMFLCC